MMDGNVKAEIYKEALSRIEAHVDAELEQFNDLEKIRKERLKQMKTQAEQQKKWITNEHGTYQEVDEKQLFDICKKSDKVAIHFYDNLELSKIFDHRLSLLAKKHIETRFLKVNSEKAPFFRDRLSLKTIPTIVFIKDNKTVGKLAGLRQLDNKKDFSAELLEWRMAQLDMINYDGDLSVRPDQQNKDKFSMIKKTIRQGGGDNDSSDSEDF